MIFFPFNESSLTETEKKRLNKFFNRLNPEKILSMNIEVHCAAQNDKNGILTRRGQNVLNHLFNLGFSKDKLHVNIQGNSKPLFTKIKYLYLNNRVEITVISL